ncbi:hypothetical protein F8388_012088 [Cannabis sativa]|uniref:Uncharacterized protein n=2 Tax=Cannabis sativa TaxID=3483 RepID=A0A7J6FTV3_CANSA|nr:hypothetical protein G4B88_020497 [Cannabis sativa]KAF4376432.1 hypothetical protein G4B88_000120 [Cannabis sativa]KAF4381166.1 hypothetical protein F8388_012088 [Cannabis sativa]
MLAPDDYKTVLFTLGFWGSKHMGNTGNKPAKQEPEEIFLKIVPPLDHAYVRWLTRDLERTHGFTPAKPRAVRPPDHYIEYMQLNGWLDVNLDDPDIAHLLKK